MQYFYGTRSSPLFPHSFEISYDKPAEEQELQIAKIGAEQLPDSCLPVGMVLEDHRLQVFDKRDILLNFHSQKVVSVPITPALQNHVLALMPPDSTIDQTLLAKPAIGFLVATGVNTADKVLTLLSPQPHPLPSRVAILSEITFVDDSN